MAGITEHMVSEKRHVSAYTDAQQHFRSNRRHLRINATLPCQVGPPDCELLTAQILDLSVGGLKFSCSQEVVDLIIPAEERTVGLMVDVTIDVHLKLPTDKKRATTIKSTASIIHSERLSQDEYHVGINFTSLSLSAIQQLSDYIESGSLPEDP